MIYILLTYAKYQFKRTEATASGSPRFRSTPVRVKIVEKTIFGQIKNV